MTLEQAQFTSLELTKPLLRALRDEGYEQPTPVQAAAVPQLLAGKDLMATAQTGTGKTAAFALPILQRLSEHPSTGAVRALVLTPTRELALQIDESFRTYGRHLRLRTAVLLGGVPMGAQLRSLRQRPDILIATPGRLLDLIKRRLVSLTTVSMLVLDEADRMLDMGFIHDVRAIVSLVPASRQTMLFSATISPEVASLASGMLRSPVRVEVAPSATVAAKLSQRVLFLEETNKKALLKDVVSAAEVRRAIVFTRTKRGANRVAEYLINSGVASEAIHSNKSQNQRQRALHAFSAGRIKVLVATDIVSRGIDVDGITHVINYELPDDAESYVHRIGRTARAGADGIALSFCSAHELEQLRDVEKLTRNSIELCEDHPFHSPAIAASRIRPHRTLQRRSGRPKRRGSRRR